MGADVTVVEMLDRVVPVEDEDVASFLEKSLKKQGKTILTGAGDEELKATATGVSAKIKTKDGKVQAGNYSHAIVAIGILPNTEGVGLDTLGVKTTKGHIDTDPYCRTNVKGLWRSEEHTSELQSLMRISYAVFCL